MAKSDQNQTKMGSGPKVTKWQKVPYLPKFELCTIVYNRRTKKIMETINVTFDELSIMVFEQSSSKLRLQSMTSRQISSGLDLTYAPSTIITQQPTEDTVPTLTNSSSQATIFPNTLQDVAGLNSHQQHAQQLGYQAPFYPEIVTDNVSNAMFDANTFVNPFATPSISAAESSSSQYVDPSNMHTFYQPYPHEFQWTKDHPLEQVIGEPLRPVFDKQAPRTWYDELSTFLLHNHFFKGTTDLTLFIRSFVDDILMVQVYVDDIIFGSTHPRYTQLFFDLMKSHFEMSMMGEMTFFLGLQVNQSPCGIFINHSNYVLEILKKYGMKSCDPVGTPIEIKDKLDLDQNETPVDATKYRSMIGALMYLTSSRLDIDSGFELTEFSDADYTGCKDIFKSTSGGAQFLDEFIKSCVENLVPNPSESEGKIGCDMPAGFTTFSNALFDADYDSNSSDDQSLPDEDDDESVSSDDEGGTKIKAFMAIAKDKPSVRKVAARSSQWVDITMKKEPLLPFHKLIGAAPSGTSESLISLSDLTFNMVDLKLDTYIPKKTRPSVKVSPTYAIKKKTEKSPAIPKPCSDKKVDSSTKQLLLTLMKKVKGLKKQIKIPSGTPPSSSQPSSSKASKQKTWFRPCKHCGLKNHLSDDCYLKPKFSTCRFTDHLTKEHLEHATIKKTLSKLKAQSPLKPSPKKAHMIPKPFKECKYYGFNDHHSDHCEFYPGCEVCGSIAHEPSGYPKKHPNSRKPRIANMQSEPTEKWKKSDVAYCIMSFIIMMENLNEVRVKELRSDNGTEFRNYKLEDFYDEKGEAVNTACYTQNISIILKRHKKTSYDVFRGRSPDIIYFYMFGCPVHIHNHMDHLGKFVEKADDGFFLGYSLVAKAFRVFNIRRQEMEETLHFKFSKDDEAISQPSTEGDPINFNENKSFLGDEFLEPRSKVTQCLINVEYFPYIPAYENTTPSESPILQVPVTFKDPPEFTEADIYLTLNEPDQIESVDHFEQVESQNNFIKPISDVQLYHLRLMSSFKPMFLKTDGQEKSTMNLLTSLVNLLLKLIEAREEKGWIIAMQKELNQFERNKVWTLVPKPHGKTIIGTKWICKNKMDENGIVIKNKARLVTQAYMGFMVYQMDVKSTFLNGKISKEVYVQQPPGFESNEFPNHFCKLDKALYGLKQAPKAWYHANPKESHLVAVKIIFRYLKGAPNLGLWSQLADYDVFYDKVPIFCDNTSVIAILNNPVLHSRTKHINIRYNFIKDHILKGDIELHFVPTDIFTKPLAEPNFTRLVAELGMLNIEKQSLIPPFEEVNANDTTDKSLSRAYVQPVTQPKAPTDLKTTKKRISPSSKPKSPYKVRVILLKKQVTETQHAEVIVATADTTKSLIASEWAEDQVNQPSAAKAENTPSPDGSRWRRFMLVMLSPQSVSNASSMIWC
nr:hypothetical protein [Tanacetum cinerariifolium]